MRRTLLAIMWASAVITGCGGRDAGPTSANFGPPAARAATMATTPDATQMMDWAEVHYPQFFPSHQANQSGYGYTYRYYPDTGNYLGINGTDIAVLGPISGGAILNVGTLSGFACDVDPVSCGRPDVVAQPQSIAVAPGANAVFEVALSPASPGSIQWQYSTDGARTFVDIAGANATTFTFNSLAADNGKWIRAVASNAQGAVTTRPARLTVTTPTVLTSCAQITSPGLYVVGADLTATPGAVLVSCLDFHNTHDVHIDCQGHTITQYRPSPQTAWLGALYIGSVKDFSVRNCVIDDNAPTIDSSEHGTLAHNTFVNSASQALVIDVMNSTRIQVYANRIAGGLQLDDGYQNTITANTMAWPAGLDGGVVGSRNGKGTLVAGNTIDGAYAGGAWQLAADDGVVLTDESDAIVQDNAIANVYDAGIEWVGMLNGAKIRRNTIAHTGYAGFGAWWWASTMNTEFVGNDISDTPRMFRIARYSGLKPTETGVYFTNNRFEANAFHTLDTTALAGQVFVYDYLEYNFASVPGASERAPTKADFHISGNVFINNNFGRSAAGPWFGSSAIVPGMIIDGGGNICRRMLGFPAPLVCN
jgi:hypothetical protein